MSESDDQQLRLFERAVDQALKSLPQHLADAVSNIHIVIEHECAEDRKVYGLYTGVPLTERDSSYTGALPDKISIYRQPLEDDFGHDPALLEEEVRATVLHELGHHFGIDENRLHELGWS